MISIGKVTIFPCLQHVISLISQSFIFYNKKALRLFSNNLNLLLVRSFSLILLVAYALLMLTFLHDKSQSNVYSVNVFRNSANALLRISSIEFHFIYSSYLILSVWLGEFLGSPHVFTLLIIFYYISDNG